MNYKRIANLQYDGCCADYSLEKWESLMTGARRANIQEINNLVKTFVPQLYYDLALNLYNPYNYYKTNKHLILVHSGIEYFLAYQMNGNNK